MCGVIGYVGRGASPAFFLNALRRLEYRGYDSAGIAMLTADGVVIQRAEGKLSQLERKLDNLPATAKVGIGHTRWATHGKPTENNAHPHRSGPIVLLHNGIIENYRQLKEMLVAKGYEFLSETDTEVAAHLLHDEYKNQTQGNPEERMRLALREVVKQLKGAFAFGILCLDTPEVLYAAKLGSPLVVGQAEGESFLASGITALVEHTRQFLVVEDHELVVLKSTGIEIEHFNGYAVSRPFSKVEWSVAMMEKGGYRHFMLKEIHEHPQAIAQTLNGRIQRDSGTINIADLGVEKLPLKSLSRLQIVACGTSFYAASLSKYFIESVTHLPVEVDLASEYRYRTSTVNAQTLVVAVSQSGETADTLQAIKSARAAGAQTLAIVNVPGSTIAHACHAESLTKAGPEIGVASTKAFAAQLTDLYLLGLALAQERQALSASELRGYVDELVKIPSLVERALGLSESIEKLANRYHQLSSLLFIGRGPQWPVALEGSLKLKELSYIHAEAYAAGELKHGPIALIDENMSVVCLAPRDAYYEKTLSNIEEIKARGGRILAIGQENDAQLAALADDYIGIPECSETILPFMTTVPLHLFAYWIAVRKGTDVDQPRNLAKSVTVE
ncbi:glutamine--fructose-6-phosphate transaminase (isomerizing) [bacterium]|nr:glutamine--fructose-6-phosphate transaminase (isomerizing) [bacterium]